MNCCVRCHLSAHGAAAADAAAEHQQEEQEYAEEDGQDDERKEVLRGRLAVAARVAGQTLAVEVGRQTASLAATTAVVARPLRTRTVICTRSRTHFNAQS